MKTLIVSDRLKPEHPVLETDCFSWADRPSVEGYPLVILDLYFGEASDDGFVDIGTSSPRFYEMGAEVARCLKADGIVIACMGPIAITPKGLSGAGHRMTAHELKRDRLKSEQLPLAERESSYDWLDQGLLAELQLGHQYVKINKGIIWTVPGDRFHRIKAAFNSYVETFTGIDSYGSGAATITYALKEQQRWDSIQNVIQRHPLIFATAEHTNLPVAMSFDYNYFHGQLVLMPTLDAPTDRLLAQLLASELKEFGEWVHSTTHVQIEELPSWTKAHLAPQAIAMGDQIAEHEQRIADLIKQSESYYRMLPLLCGTGTDLENAFEEIFDSANTGIGVTRSAPGAHIDMFVRDSSGRSLAVEVTGVKGALRHNDRHWADFLNYLPEHNAKNEELRVERIVLVVNTFRDLPTEERDRDRDMTSPVKKTAGDNGICVVRSMDLYSLWLKCQAGMSPQEIFDALFATEGIYTPVEPAN